MVVVIYLALSLSKVALGSSQNLDSHKETVSTPGLKASPDIKFQVSRATDR